MIEFESNIPTPPTHTNQEFNEVEPEGESESFEKFYEAVLLTAAIQTQNMIDRSLKRQKEARRQR